MTNMPNELINTSAQLADKSPWAWLIFLFLSWIVMSAYGLRYTVKRLEEASVRVSEIQNEKVALVVQMSKEREELHQAQTVRLEGLIREHLSTQLKVVEILNRLERAIEHNRPSNLA